MSTIATRLAAIQRLGLRVVLLRAGVLLRKRLGLTRRTFRPRPWNTITLADICRPGTPTATDEYAGFRRAKPPPFLFPLGTPLPLPLYLRSGADSPVAERTPSLSDRLALLAQDRCVYFFHTPSPDAIDWHANPFESTHSDPHKTWCDLSDFLPQQGDARTLWEPSRAAWAIDLARAKPHGHDVAAGPLLWRWIDSWMTANPPFLGFQWKCGQESSVRLMAIALAIWSLADDPSMTAERWTQFARLAWATGYRVEREIHYALSQKNNHALSEACGLLLIAHLFPEFNDADRWHDLGRRVLERELPRQIYDDGSYVQHSMNYHRVMLQVSVLAMRLEERAGRPFPRPLYERIDRAADFLLAMMEPANGRAPNYGHNDGAWVLPVNECDFADFRPAVAAAHYLVHQRRLFPAGPWDEDLYWLFGDDLPDAPDTMPEPASRAFDSGGYYTIRRPTSWAMIRCHDYRDRPGQCDGLHLDLWWKGHNILQDAGTWRYYAPDRPDLERYFKSTAAHNTIEVDGVDPLILVSRFLWVPWPKAQRQHFVTTGSAHWFEGRREDYLRPPWRVLHRRVVISLDNGPWVVVDDLLGTGRHGVTARWHLIDGPFEVEPRKARLTWQTPAGRLHLAMAAWPEGAALSFDVKRGRDEPDRVMGFVAPCYGSREPIPVVEANCEAALPIRLITVVGEGSLRLQVASDASQNAVQRWSIADETRAWTIELSPPSTDAPAIFRAAIET